MAEPLTKEERDEIDVRIAKMYRVHHQTETHETLAQAIRRYEATVKDRDDRIAALEAEVARLRLLAEVGEAVEGMPAGYALHHYDDASWLVRESNLSGWEKLPFPPTVTGAMKKAAEEYSYDPTWDAALRAAKGESCSSDS